MAPSRRPCRLAGQGSARSATPKTKLNRKFLQTADGYINADRIVRVIQPHTSQGKETLLHYVDEAGTSAVTALTDGRELAALLGENIPAAPGFRTVHVDDDQAPHEVWFSAVIGWRSTQTAAVPRVP